MLHAQNTKDVNVAIAQSVLSTATLTANIDTLGFDYAQVKLRYEADTTASIVQKLSESETSDGSFTDITAFVGGGTGGFTIPASGTALKTVIMNVDLRSRMRWLKLTHNSGDAALLQSADVTLDRAHTLPDTAAEAGATVLVNG